MHFLTHRLVNHPSPAQARWLAAAMPLSDARWGWLSSHLLFIGVFAVLRLSRTGPILSVMVAILVVTACATSLAPLFYRSLCAYSALRLRASMEKRRCPENIGAQPWAFASPSLGWAA